MVSKVDILTMQRVFLKKTKLLVNMKAAVNYIGRSSTISPHYPCLALLLSVAAGCTAPGLAPLNCEHNASTGIEKQMAECRIYSSYQYASGEHC